MKIIDSRPSAKTTQYSKLSDHTTFLFQNELFIKVNNNYAFNPANCEPEDFCGDEETYPIEIEIHIIKDL